MGFQPPKEVYRLRFEEYPELEITTKGASLGKLFDLMKLEMKASKPEEAKKALTFFTKKVISWNMEHPAIDEDDATEQGSCDQCGLFGGDPVPPTPDAALCMGMTFLLKIIVAWVGAITRVPGPKESNSNNGGYNQEDLMRKLGELQNQSKLPQPKFS